MSATKILFAQYLNSILLDVKDFITGNEKRKKRERDIRLILVHEIDRACGFHHEQEIGGFDFGYYYREKRRRERLRLRLEKESRGIGGYES